MDGAAPDWDAVQAALDTSILHWEAAGRFNAFQASNLSLPRGVVLYASVRVRNGAGLWSLVDVSDGVELGKNELKPSEDVKASVGIDARSGSDNFTSP